MTLHGSKGLEFPGSDLYGVRKNSIPLSILKTERLVRAGRRRSGSRTPGGAASILCGNDQSEGGAGPSDLWGAVRIPFRAAGRGSFAGDGTGIGGDRDEAAEFV